MTDVTEEQDATPDEAYELGYLAGMEEGYSIGQREMEDTRVAKAEARAESAEATIAQAPHELTCGSHPMNGVSDHGCTCWKADHEAAKEALDHE